MHTGLEKAISPAQFISHAPNMPITTQQRLPYLVQFPPSPSNGFSYTLNYMELIALFQSFIRVDLGCFSKAQWSPKTAFVRSQP